LAPDYVGAKVCGSCHSEIFERQQKSGHARALAPAPADSPVRADWAFGAADQAVTYVSRADEDYYVEHGLSYYAASKSLALTPGHSSAAGERYRIFDPGAAILRCFQCHSTGRLKLGDDFRIEPAETGVRCEACHGPGAGHPGKTSAIRNPGKLTAVELNSLCGGCHRMPPAAGDETNWNNPWNARHQPVYLSQSACFQKSAGALSCLTCHSPHDPVSREAGTYDKTCRGCHSMPKHRTAVAGKNCAGCHMPPVKPHPQLSFANHWIGVYTAGNHLRPRR
jgi:hypothetical protein